MPDAIGCPSCGSTQVTFDYDAVLSVSIADGAVRHVVLGGVLDVLPDRVMCAVGCPAYADPAECPRPLGEAVSELLDATLPSAIRDGLANEHVVFDTPGAASALTDKTAPGTQAVRTPGRDGRGGAPAGFVPYS